MIRVQRPRVKLPTTEQVLGALPVVAVGLRILSNNVKKKNTAKVLTVVAAITEAIITHGKVK